MLPVLVVLFLLSYGLMATLVVEQNQTIDSQRGLIRDLFSDSGKLFALQGKMAMGQHAAPKANAPQAHAPAAEPPAATPKAPDARTRVADKTSETLRNAHPEKPPRVVDDEMDGRRVKLKI